MIDIFSTKNLKNYLNACRELEKNGIEYYTAENYVINRDYTFYRIFTDEEDAEKSLELLNRFDGGNLYYYEQFDLSSFAVLFLLVTLVLVVLWTKSID